MRAHANSVFPQKKGAAAVNTWRPRSEYLVTNNDTDFRIWQARKYLNCVGRLCTHIAQSPDDREVRAALRTLLDMRALLERNGLVDGMPELGSEPFNITAAELAAAWKDARA